MSKLFPIVLFSLVFSSGCSSASNNAEISEITTAVSTLTQEEESQLEFCHLVYEAWKSYDKFGMSYETRDRFGKAYDVIHEMVGTYDSTRYRDYNDVMADHSYAYGPFSDFDEVYAINRWCETIGFIPK